MTAPAPHLTDPATPLVALEGGLKRRRVFHADRLTTRSTGHRHGHAPDHPYGSDRRYPRRTS